MEPIRIFLSYAREDYVAVKIIYDRLRAEGYQPWMDKVDLLPGEVFATAIPEVIRTCDFFIVCLSSRSVTKRSFLQREIKVAFDAWTEKLEGDLYIFPVRLDDCEAPSRIKDFHWADLFGAEAGEEWEKLLRSLRQGAARLDKASPAAQTVSPAPSTFVLPPPASLSAATSPKDEKPVRNANADATHSPSLLAAPNSPELVAPVNSTGPPKLPPLKIVTITGGVLALIMLGSIAIRQYWVGQPRTGAPPTTTATALLAAGNPMTTFIEDLGNGVRLEMVKLPGGSFQMGSPSTEEGRDGDEGPQHSVTVSPFAISKYEVTQMQWQAVMGNNHSNFKGADLPVEQVLWEEAQAFCQKLSSKTEKHYRLPTEAEWEYACRAGTTGAYAGIPDEIGWDGANSGGKTHLVGQKKSNAFGLFDMHGNVWEWCQDWYGDYSSQSQTDPTGPSSGVDRVLRGGSWRDVEMYCRSAIRGRRGSGVRESHYGFRLVQTTKVH